MLYTTFFAGARGWIAWTNTDFDGLQSEEPYRHHPFETHFGRTDASGRAKPQLRELGRCAAVARELYGRGWEPARYAAAIAVPEHFESVLPFVPDSLRAEIRANLFQSYNAARKADLAPVLARERDGLSGGHRLALFPSAQLVTAPAADQLRTLAVDGAAVYASYFSGGAAHHRGPRLDWYRTLFHVHHRLRYGLVNRIEVDEVVLDFRRALGSLRRGTQLRLWVAGNEHARAYLPVDLAGAEVVAVDQQGRPVLLRHRVGMGTVVLSTYPLEHLAPQSPDVNPEDTWRLCGHSPSWPGWSGPSGPTTRGGWRVGSAALTESWTSWSMAQERPLRRHVTSARVAAFECGPISP